MTAASTPSVTIPANGAYANTALGTDVNVAGTFHSPVSGDRIETVEAQVCTYGSTDGSPTPVATKIATAASVGWSLSGARWSGRIAGLAHRTHYRIRARVHGTKSSWSPWSTLTAHAFWTNALPGETANPVMDRGTLTPTFAASLVDADGTAAYLTGVQLQDMLDLPSGESILRWDSGETDIGGTSTRYSLAYGGVAKGWGDRGRWRDRVRDNDQQWGPWSGWRSYVLEASPGPTTMSPNTTTSRVSVTPTLTIGNGSAFDQFAVEIYADESGSGTPLYASGTVAIGSTTSTTHDVPADKLTPGTTVWWRARIRLTGGADLGEWSILVPFRTASLPGVPSSVSPGSANSAVPVIVGDTTPELTAIYEDADIDGWGDAPSWRTVEVQTAAGAGVVTNTDAAPAYTVPMAWTVTPALSATTAYRQRWRFKDALAVYSPYSEWVYFTVEAAPTATLVAPTEASSVTDPTPVLDWAYAGGQPQASYRIQLTVTATGELVYDSGTVVSADSAVTVPAWLLVHATGYTWSVEVVDAFGMSGTMAPATFTSNFSTPATPTGLTATPDSATSGVALAWDTSGLSADEWNSWRIYRRNNPEATAYDLIAEITTQATLAYTDYGAALLAAVAYQLVQTNGWAESTAATATATLTSVQAGAWQLVGTDSLELLDVTAAERSAEAPFERHVALGRSLPVDESGPLSGQTGTLSVSLFDADVDTEVTIREMADLDDPVYLKSPYGDSWAVRITSVSATPQPTGIDVSISWAQVA